MTAKERIIAALRLQQSDTVPVTLGLSEMVPVRKSGLNYIEFFWHEKLNLGHCRCDAEKSFGADVFLHGAEGPAPEDPPVTVEPVSETRDKVIWREVIHTCHGPLESLKQLTTTESVAILKELVDDPEADCAKVLELLQHPETKDFSAYADLWNYVGPAGHCGFWLSTPFDWWGILRRSPEVAIYDLLDCPEVMRKIFAAYTEYGTALLETFLRKHRPMADSIGLGGSSTSMSVGSPALLAEWTVPFVRAIKAVTARYEVPLQYHMCGRSREAIPLLVAAGVDGMDALESPPTGNVDLAEVKRLFGSSISLRGNVNSITVMLQGTPADVERDVIRCLDSAKAGGGYILGVGDQTPYWTPDENLAALVSTGRKYGSYPGRGGAR